MSKELRREIQRTLEELTNGEPESLIFLTSGTESLTVDAVRYLNDIGALSISDSDTYRITAFGREYGGETLHACPTLLVQAKLVSSDSGFGHHRNHGGGSGRQLHLDKHRLTSLGTDGTIKMKEARTAGFPGKHDRSASRG